jgi:hypothetical protein
MVPLLEALDDAGPAADTPAAQLTRPAVLRAARRRAPTQRPVAGLFRRAHPLSAADRRVAYRRSRRATVTIQRTQ